MNLAIKECKELLADAPEVYNSKSFAKWKKMDNKGLQYFVKHHYKTFKRRLSRGTPQKYRWLIWTIFLDIIPNDGIYNEFIYISISSAKFYIDMFTTSKIGKSLSQCDQWYKDYYEYAAGVPNKYSPLISIDVPRTFPELNIFKDHEPQECLFRVLNAVANHIPDVGYCQGMNFVAAVLLITSNFDEQGSFFVLIIILEKYGLAGFYREKFPLLNKYIKVFNNLFALNIPKLWRHFQKEGIIDAIYLHPWFLTLFVSALPLKTVVILWDYIIAHGIHSLLSIAIALLKAIESALIDQSMENIIQFFKSLRISVGFDDITCGKILLYHAQKIHLSDEIKSEINYNHNIQLDPIE
ncbi:TBC domain-containing protein [Cryptosporidium serpentis]